MDDEARRELRTERMTKRAREQSSGDMRAVSFDQWYRVRERAWVNKNYPGYGDPEVRLWWRERVLLPMMQPWNYGLDVEVGESTAQAPAPTPVLDISDE